jgi:MOSC domain-containing protein YiiM
VIEGRVVRVSRKPEREGEHGLPKMAVAEARITRAGVEGDFNRYRHEVKRDDPGMAILIMPVEMIRQLNREGWPVEPGDLGENLCTEGIPYDAFVPGRRLRVGGATLEVVKACTPCDNLYLLPYVGERRGPAFLKAMIDRRGWYSKVLEEGTVRTDDRVALESE